MKNRSSYAVLTRFGIIAAVLATLVLIAPAVSAAETFTYPENGTEPVATFTATDADGDDIVWGLDGDDKGDFKIDGGVLSFKSPPNFEGPADDRGDNVYKVKVTASGGSIDVEVTVTDVDEPGKPGLSKPQPQVGRGLEATGPGDPDKPVTDVTWQWARSMDMETWTDIGNPSASGSRNPTEDDIGYYLRATAMYTDKHGSGKTASVVSENPVEERTVANARPSFSAHDDSDDTTDGLQIARAVDEGVKGALVGKPITASDDDDALVYSLGGTDAGNYNINDRTGQLTTKSALNSDDDGVTGDDDTDTPKEETDTVTVTVVDPSGADASVTVVITINDVNDAPKFDDDAPKTLYVTEGTGRALFTALEDGVPTTALPADAYQADDDDAGDINTGTANADGTPPTKRITYAVGGADKGSFAIDADGVLTIKSDHTPNFEKQKEYSITLMVEDDEFAVGTHDVKVMVVNAEDAGSVSLTAREPQVGKAVVANLSDGDGNVRGPKWQWYKHGPNETAPTLDALTDDVTACAATDDQATVITTLCRINGETSPAYTPKAADVGEMLVARVSYTDAFVTDTGDDGDDGDGAFKSPERVVQISDPANTAPKFADDQDPNKAGKQADAERSVAENAKNANVGEPVVASDSDLLMYSVDDTDNFSVDNNGQIKTKVALDYEALPEDAKYLMVVLTAEDPSGATDSINVKINVTDENDGAVISLATGPAPDPAGPDCMSAAGGVSSLAADCQTLLNLMDELVGDGTELNWNVDTSIDDWDGLAFRDEDGNHSGRVLRIFLANAGLAGVVPAGFSDLDALEKLTLHSNDLTGEIPDLSGLDNLTHLVLNDNMLTGSIPEELGDMAELDYLYLHRNELSGSIPAELGNATQLRRIWLHGNDLAGSIPADLGNLSRLRNLVLSNNMLTGEIPAELANAIHLKQIYLDDNMLSGMIPAELGSIMDDSGTLLRLYVRNNMLTGMIPSELGNLVDLTHLRLSGNMLEGCVPADIFDAVDDGLDLMACAADDES